MRTLRGLTAAGIAALFILASTISAFAAPATSQPFTTDPVRPFIVGGVPATEAYPAASVQINHNGDPNWHLCTGVLFDADTVVTAGHCLTRPTGGFKPELPSLHVRVGSTDRTTGGVVRKVTGYQVHPDWDYARNPNKPVSDVAVLHLARPVWQKPLPILKRVTGADTRLIGWGLTATTETTVPTMLHQLDTRIVPAQQCADGGITAGELCVANVGGAAGPCNGDSGGPAMQRGRHGWKAVGGGSRIIGKVCGASTAIYTDWTAFADWIARAALTPAIPSPNPPRTNSTPINPDLHWFGEPLN